jgi:hypothetical protein
LSSAWCALTVFHAAANRSAKKGSPINQITGPSSGATPNPAEIKANAIRMIEAQTPKAMSEEFSRIEVEAPTRPAALSVRRDNIIAGRHPDLSARSSR